MMSYPKIWNRKQIELPMRRSSNMATSGPLLPSSLSQQDSIRYQPSPQSEVSRRTPASIALLPKLCRSCRNIDFDRCLRKKMKRKITLDRFNRLHGDCPFCRLVTDCGFQAGLRSESIRSKHVLLDNELSWQSSVVYAPYDGTRNKGYSTHSDARAAAKEASGGSAYSLVISLAPQIFLGYIQYISLKEPLWDQKSERFFGRRVDKTRIDMSLLKDWLPRCRKIHGKSCEESGGAAGRRPRSLRVIDVSTRLVVRASLGCEYVALSYCWGDQGSGCTHAKTRKKDIRWDEDGNEMPTALPCHLPQTIEDAIYVTRKIGLKYLWVDALCIIQDSENDKHTQILRMDGIYSSAVLTIAAASGIHANSGLAGISRPRRSQRIATVDGIRLALPLPNYMSLLWDPSLNWNSRGWTFQEKVLSKRLLLFTDYQVYFQCSNMVWCEDIALETERCSASKEKMWRPLRWAADRQVWREKANGLDLGNYLSVIQQYTPRQLRDPKDGVNAITGVLKTMEAVMGSFHSGIPTNYFGPALLWQPVLGAVATRLDKPNAPFPSWSWARWQLTEGCKWEAVNLADTCLVHVSFLLEPSGQSRVRLLPLSAPANEPRASVLFSRRSARKWVTAMPKRSVVPQPFLLSSEVRAIDAVRFGLYFATTFVRNISIGAIIKPKHVESHEHRFVQHELYADTVVNKCVGHITISAAIRHRTGNRPLELITICWSIGYDGPDIDDEYVPRAEVETFAWVGPQNAQTLRSTTQKFELRRQDYPVANVMLVDWDGNVAERVAMGSIVRPAWEKFSEGSRWIVLG